MSHGKLGLGFEDEEGLIVTGPFKVCKMAHCTSKAKSLQPSIA